MTWLLVLAFAAYLVVFRAAREAWNRRWTKFSAEEASCGLTGAEVVRRMLAADGVQGVRVARGRGGDTARYDGVRKRVILGRDVHEGKSIAAVTVAAHAAAEALPALRREPAGVWRRRVTGFGRGGIGVLVLGLFGVACFRPILFRLLPWLILAGGVFLLAAHALTLGWEYRVAKLANERLDASGWITRREEEAYREMGKAAPLREVTGIFHGIGRVFAALLPLRGWK